MTSVPSPLPSPAFQGCFNSIPDNLRTPLNSVSLLECVAACPALSINGTTGSSLLALFVPPVPGDQVFCACVEAPTADLASLKVGDDSCRIACPSAGGVDTATPAWCGGVAVGNATFYAVYSVPVAGGHGLTLPPTATSSPVGASIKPTSTLGPSVLISASSVPGGVIHAESSPLASSTTTAITTTSSSATTSTSTTTITTSTSTTTTTTTTTANTTAAAAGRVRPTGTIENGTLPTSTSVSASMNPIATSSQDSPSGDRFNLVVGIGGALVGVLVFVVVGIFAFIWYRQRQARAQGSTSSARQPHRARLHLVRNTIDGAAPRISALARGLDPPSPPLRPQPPLDPT
ncbi:hypothetical protein BDK51DRAFT_47179 [Blyttiomyces helicus]|uniref:WSC domain-containing protein n=1 Tax=Blyttiomyces helicus TaxID=388810 RepID=A0A4P9VZC1_9FUNG|nr:hypothetical protein BDK51DRAFT_47179 [Blyttiomyces helicus]|eukprot:RKO85161.1 hypothetical protein BDK51DRAFT_47179 [Blyttiomyces helicus]